ncbi:MAG: hypothetical protein IKF72_02190 [Kiritimatiellae bacterium]|nr:hypothetical protein [Kiritimatiellia bacterium]
MTRDLDETLRELGDEYRPVVDRLLAAYSPPRHFSAPPAAPCAGRTASAVAWGVALLAAASLMAFLGFGLVFRDVAAEKVYAVRVSDAAREYQLAVIRDDKAVQEMIRTQRPDGGWGSDFLTRRNAEALRLCTGAEAQVAYRRAARNLRLRGQR